jgi:hypothetical protein
VTACSEIAEDMEIAAEANERFVKSGTMKDVYGTLEP